MYHFNKNDIARLKRAVAFYADKTGSEYLWDEYHDLLNKLKTYEEQNLIQDESWQYLLGEP